MIRLLLDQLTQTDLLKTDPIHLQLNPAAGTTLEGDSHQMVHPKYLGLFA